MLLQMVGFVFFLQLSSIPFFMGAMLLKLCSKAQAGEDPRKSRAFTAGSPITHPDFVILHYTIGFVFACIVAKG